MSLLPILGRPTVWRFGELASLKLAMISLGVIVALGTPARFWTEYYWLVWLVFAVSMVIPASKWFSVFTGNYVKPKGKKK